MILNFKKCEYSLLHLECNFFSKISIVDFVLYVSFATFHQKETIQVEIGD